MKTWSIHRRAATALLLAVLINVLPQTGAVESEPQARKLATELNSLRLKLANGPERLDAQLRKARPEILQLAGDIVHFSESDSGRAFGVLLASELFRISDHDPELESMLIMRMIQSRNPSIVERAKSRDRLMKQMRVKPAELILSGFDGSLVDLSSYRGKVVLVNLWNRHCESCIESMPILQSMYESYRDKGFEVVGVCTVGSDSDRHASLALLKRNHVTWSNAELPLEDSNQKLESFGSPQGGGVYFLLNRDGLLERTDICGGWLEFEILRVLGLEAD